MVRPLPEPLVTRFSHQLTRAQREWRAASVVAAMVRGGEPVWWHGVGVPRVEDQSRDDGLTPDTQYRIGSITKTFTAVLVMQCRDDGLLDLDDPLETHLPGTGHGELSIRRMLAHRSGLQREPAGDIWETLAPLSSDELIASAAAAEQVLAPARRWHYSNLAFALLGEMVARLRHATYERVLDQRLLTPLGLSHTGLSPSGPCAAGYFTHPYSDRLLPEPVEPPSAAFASAGQIWSTPADLARWGAFLADPDPAVLSPDTVEEMCHPQVMNDLDGWTLGWGLGLMLHRRGERVLVGHDGAMPGFLASLVVRRPEKLAAAVLTNTGSGADPTAVALDLVLGTLDDDPEPPVPFRPGEPAPEQVVPLLGRWWSEGSEFVFAWRDGALEARRHDLPAHKPPARFAPDGPDVWRTISGREHGELLRAVRDDQGGVVKLYWATYPFTREPRTFAGPARP